MGLRLESDAVRRGWFQPVAEEFQCHAEECFQFTRTFARITTFMKEYAFIHEHGKVPAALRELPFLGSFDRMMNQEQSTRTTAKHRGRWLMGCAGELDDSDDEPDADTESPCAPGSRIDQRGWGSR